MDATPHAYRLVGTDKQLGCLGVEFTKEQTVAVHGIVEQLDGGRRTEVGILPATELPHHPTLLVHLDGLHRSMDRVHRLFVPFVVPVVHEVVAVLQTHRLLGLRHTVVRRIHLPHRLSLAVDFLYQTLTPRDEQISRLGHLLHRPRQHARPSIDLLAVSCKLVNTTHRHVRYQVSASARQAGIAKLSVYRTLLIRRQHELAHNTPRWYLHHHRLGGFTILHKHHV